MAEAFDKQHADVLKVIRRIDDNPDHDGEFSLMVYQKEIGSGAVRNFPMYELTRKGFTRLVMEFSGPKASKVKDKFNDALYRMEQELVKKSQVFDPSQLSRLEILRMALEAEGEKLSQKSEGILYVSSTPVPPRGGFPE